jgi:hypothetical protein
MNNKIQALWQGWQRVAKKIGDFQARLILTLFYFLIVLPTGLIARLFADPLALRKKSAEWEKRVNVATRLEEARRQF